MNGLANGLGKLLVCSLVVLGACVGVGRAHSGGAGDFLAAGGKIYYQVCGESAQTVVLLHDGVLDSLVWDDVWSPRASSGYYETDDLAVLLRHLKIKRAAIVGSSHGGEISINFALQHPEIVQQLVLVGAVVGGFPYSAHFLERGEALGKPLEKNDIAGAIAAAQKDKYLVAAGNENAKRRMAAILAANPQDMTHASLELLPKPALSRLHEIQASTLLLAGDADIPDVHAHAGAIEAGIPRARRVVLKDVGHLMYLEKPAEFVEEVSRFLEQNE